MSVHPTALVEAGAALGAEVEIGPFAVVCAGARIGDGCRIGPHATIFGSVRLGERCRVHAGAVLGDTPQDLAFQDIESLVEIGPECTIREGVTIHRGTKAGTATVVGPRCYLMANSHVAHNARLGERVILANGVLIAGYAEIGDFAFISGNCAVHQFCRIGRLAMVGGGAMLSKDCPPFCIVRANTLNRVAGLNIIGLRRSGFDAEARRQIKEAFDVFYRSDLNVRQALAALAARGVAGLAAEFAVFAESSTRGLCSGPGSGAEAGAGSE